MASTSSDLVHEDDGSDNSPPNDETNDKTDGKETSSTNKHIEWAKNVTLADFVVTNDNQSIVSVKGEAIKKVSLKNLLAICAKYNISGYKAKNKETVCALIARKINASNVASNMYNRRYTSTDATGANDPEAIPTATVATDRVTKPTAKASKPTATSKPSKSTAPEAIKKGNSYYRILNTYFLEKHRPHVLQLGRQLTLAELDARKMQNNDPSGKGKWNKYENKGGKVTKLLTSALASFNSEDRIQMMKKKGEQTDKLINLASEKYELEKQKHSVTMESLEIDKDTKLLDRETKLTSLLEVHSKNLARARAELREILNDGEYTPTSSPVTEKRNSIALCKDLYNKAFNDLSAMTKEAGK